MQHKRRNFLRKMATMGGVVAMPAIPSVVLAGGKPSRIKNIRFFNQNDYTRVVLELDQPVQHKVFTLEGPDRVVIDVTQATVLDSGLTNPPRGSLLRGIRTGIHNNTDLRVVLDVTKHVQPRSFMLKPGQQPANGEGHRLVIELHDPGVKPKAHTARKQASKLRNVVVAIDAGHGGKDPGAIGRLGTREKDVTLQVARKLEKLINAQPGMKAVQIRSGDHFIGLRDRIKKARAHKADLLVSLHADAFHDPRANGSSVFALSVNGASSEAARWLAEKENAADLIGGVTLGDKDDMVAEVLLDLSLTGTIQSSLDVGDEVLRELKQVGKVHKSRVQQAGFTVLKSPDIPSVLLETAFISNPREERKLRSSAHQEKLAKAIMRGVNDYFARKAPPGTLLSQKPGTYVVRSGDTLSEIAVRHQVSLSDLRRYNDIKSDSLRAGQKLKIPVQSS